MKNKLSISLTIKKVCKVQPTWDHSAVTQTPLHSVLWQGWLSLGLATSSPWQRLSSTTLLRSLMHCTVLVLNPDMEDISHDDRKAHGTKLGRRSKKLIGMPAVIALLTQKRRDRTWGTKPIVIFYILRIVLLTVLTLFSTFLQVVTFCFHTLFLPVFRATHSDLAHTDQGLLIQEKHCSSPHLD